MNCTCGLLVCAACSVRDCPPGVLAEITQPDERDAFVNRFLALPPTAVPEPDPKPARAWEDTIWEFVRDKREKATSAIAELFDVCEFEFNDNVMPLSKSDPYTLETDQILYRFRVGMSISDPRALATIPLTYDVGPAPAPPFPMPDFVNANARWTS